MTSHHQNKKLLVLDLDETLVHARKRPLDRAADFRALDYHVYRRPHLARFLGCCAEWYALAVWSSGSDAYVEHVVQEIFPAPETLQFVWAASRTTTRRTMPEDIARFGGGIGDFHNRKPLQKLKRQGWSLDDVLIVDDSPEKSALNYGNVVHPRPFEGAADDDELRHLARYLETLKGCGNFRAVEKRGWRGSVLPMDWPTDC